MSNSEWNISPSDEVISKTIESLKSHGIDVVLVNTKEDALAELKRILPDGAELSTGSSTTLNEIGFNQFLNESGEKYNNLGAKVWTESDPVKRVEIRKKATTADYFFGSINAITEDGKLVGVDNTGSRVGAYPFAASRVIIVSGVNKIVKDLDSAFKRIKEHVFPLEDKRAQSAYGHGSGFGKWVIIENEIVEGRITVVLVKEVLGF